MKCELTQLPAIHLGGGHEIPGRRVHDLRATGAERAGRRTGGRIDEGRNVSAVPNGPPHLSHRTR